MQILFYRSTGLYGCFTNFSRDPVEIYGRTWMTSEHAFQAMKFHPDNPEIVELIAKAETPSEAAKLGRNKDFPLRKDWDINPPENILDQLPTFQPDDGIIRKLPTEPLFERMKDVIMYEVLMAKFSNPKLREVLLSTGSNQIVEDSPIDYYWGWGLSQEGQNKLGRLLMLVRTQLI